MFCFFFVVFLNSQVMQSSTVIFIALRFTTCMMQLISGLRPSASLTAYTIRAVLSGGFAKCPIFHVFVAPVSFAK